MKKLNINKACPGPDLSSISALPPVVDNSRHVNTLRTRLDGRSAQAAQVFNNRHIPPLRNSYIPLNSQSQQSFSQLSQNTPFSQNSQEEIILNDQWRYGSQERENSHKRTSFFAPYSYGSSRDESSQVLSLTRPASANNTIQRSNHGSYPDRISEELEQRLSSVDTALNRVLQVFNSVQSDLHQVNKAVKEISLETEGIRKQIVVQENTLQQLIKEEEGMKESILGTLKIIPNRIIEETSKLNLDELSDALKAIPKMMTERLSAMKSELCLTLNRSLQDMSQRLKKWENEYEPAKKIAMQPSKILMKGRSQTKHLQKEYHKPSSYNVLTYITPKRQRTQTYQIPKTEPVTENSSDSWNATDCYQPFNHAYTRNRKRDVIEQECPYNEQQKSKMSEILINIEDDEDEQLLYFMKPPGKARKVHFLDDPCGGHQEQPNLYEEDDEESRRILRKARRKRKFEASYNFKYSPGSSSDY